jgi:hypothetical protein
MSKVEIEKLPLWESRWPEALLRKRYASGEIAFNRGFRQRPYSLANLYFNEESVRSCENPHLPLKEIYRHGEMVCFTGIDPSTESRPGTAIFTLAMTDDGIRVPVDIRVGRWKTRGRSIEEIEGVLDQFKPLVCFVENNALQGVIIDWLLTRNRSATIEAFTTGRNKADLKIGIPGMALEFDNGGWIIPMGDTEHPKGSCECSWCLWLLELKRYPYYPSSDLLMASWFAREAARKYWLGNSKSGDSNVSSWKEEIFEPEEEGEFWV